jgi:hypothetical protein
MTQAFNLSQLANNLNSSGQLDATDGLVNAVPVGNGGTGVSSLTGVVYGNATSAFTAATSSQLKSAIGTLSVGDGGTGATSFTSNSLLKGNGTSAISSASGSDVASAIGSNYVANATNATTAASCSGNSATATKLSTASGSAPSYSARAWVNFDGTGTIGTNMTIRASANVASVYKVDTGQFTITFTIAMPDANYAISGFVATTGNSGIGGVNGGTGYSLSAGSCTIFTRSTSTRADYEQTHVIFHR